MLVTWEGVFFSFPSSGRGGGSGFSEGTNRNQVGVKHLLSLICTMSMLCKVELPVNEELGASLVPDAPELEDVGTFPESDVEDTEGMAGDGDDPLALGALHLEEVFAKHSFGMQPDGNSASGSTKAAQSTFLRRAHAAAELTTRREIAQLQAIIQYVKQHHSAGELEPIMWLQHRLYDETPLPLRVFFDDTAEVQRAKLWVVQRSAGCLLKVRRHQDRGQHVEGPEDFLFLNIPQTSCVRATQNVVGETVKAMLDSCEPGPCSLPEARLRVRLAETDEGGNNGRAEALTLLAQPEFCHLWGLCLAHKLHIAAKKTWALAPLDLIVTGLKSACLVFRAGGAWKSMRDAVPQLVEDELQFLDNVAVSPQAVAHKERLLTCFLPSDKQPHRRSVILLLTETLNHDWRAESLSHSCRGCCRDRQHACEKLSACLRRTLTALRPTMFCQDNWQEWGATLPIFAFGCAMHQWLPKLYWRAFGCHGHPQHPLPHPDDDEAQELGAGHDDEAYAAEPGLDKQAWERERLAKAQRKASAFFAESYLADIYLMQVALQPEQQLMAEALHQGSVAAELQGMQAQETLGWRCYKAQGWHEGIALQRFFNASFENVCSQAPWESLLDTEECWTKIFKVGLRPAATVWLLVHLRTQTMPYSLFGLLSRVSREELENLADQLHRTPTCMRDSFGKKFLALFPERDALLSETAKQILSSLATCMATNTYSVERQHAGNARRARCRVHTHVADVRALALAHQGFSGPAVGMPVTEEEPKTNDAASEKSCLHSSEAGRRRPLEGVPASSPTDTEMETCRHSVAGRAVSCIAACCYGSLASPWTIRFWLWGAVVALPFCLVCPGKNCPEVVNGVLHLHVSTSKCPEMTRRAKSFCMCV